MPRVSTKKKSTRGEPYNCQGCSKKIVAGEEYHEWSFRYGGTQRQHTAHGFPRGSQLTQSKMSQAHAACEELEDALGNGSLDNVSDIADAVQSCMDSLQEVMDEYEEAINNMPASEEQNRERIDQLQETYDSLDNAKDYSGDDLEEEDSDDSDEERERKNEDNEAKLSGYRDEILDAVGSRSF
jgi:chemotaxis protein histidine kinase CheA